MTQVEFQFFTPLGVPILNAPFEVQLAKSAHEDDEDGIVMPRLVIGNTGPAGKVILSLRKASVPYYVTMQDPASEASLGYKFVVPELDNPSIPVRLQDLVIDLPISSTTYDEAAFAAIHAAKANALAAQVAAAQSEANAKTYEQSAAASKQAVIDAAASTTADRQIVQAALITVAAAKTAVETAQADVQTKATAAVLASQNAIDAATVALGYRDSTNTSKIAAQVSEANVASMASAVDAAKVTVLSAKDVVITARDATTAAKDTATQKATDASTSAAAALASQNAAAASDAAALISKNAASGFASDALTSKNAANASASLAQDWATKTASEVVVGQGYGAKKYANDAATSAAAAATAKTAAETASTNAGNSATAANTAKTAAETAKVTAETKATEAATSAATAATKATEASGYATAAATSAATAAAGQIQSNWTQADTQAKDYIKNKPPIPTQYTDVMTRATVLTGFSTATNSAVVATDSILVGMGKLQAQVDGKENAITATTTDKYLRGDKTMQILNTAAVAESTNLYFTNARARSAISVSGSLSYNSATGVISYTAPVLATVASSGSYTDLTNKPAIPAAYSDTQARAAISATGSLAYNSTTGVISYTAPVLATVATTGSYSDLSNKPTIPTQYTDALVRAVPLTGLSTATNANVVDTDTILVAVGKLQAQLGSVSTVLASIIG